MKSAPLIWGLAGILLCGGVARAQSLAEIAKKEEERRKATKSTGKVYTNDDLRRYPVLPPPSQPAPPADAPGAADPVTGAKEPAAAPAEPKEEKDEAYWRKLISDAKARLARTTAHHEAMQTRINSLTTDFYARDDPAQRAVIWTDRTKALEELDRLAKDIDDQKKAIARSRRTRGRPGSLRAGCVEPAVQYPILIVEDSDSLRTMLRHTLESHGHAVVEARDQPEADRHLQQGGPALVLSDLRLPAGDGFGVLRAAKDRGPRAARSSS